MGNWSTVRPEPCTRCSSGDCTPLGMRGPRLERMFMSLTRETALPSRLAVPRSTRPTQPSTTPTSLTPNPSPPASPEGESRIDRLLPIEAAAKPTLSILVIDDERTLRESCAARLKAEGHQDRDAGRGGEALEPWRRHAVDIARIDLYMSE